MRSLLLGLLVLGCDAPATPPSDAGPDASAFSPEPPEPPSLLPCPDGWREVGGGGAPVTCDPWPAEGREDCSGDTAHFPGGPGCERVGPECPADGWPADLDPARPVVWVSAGAAAGGDGSTRELALPSIADAAQRAPAGATIAVASGTYREPPFEIGADTIVRGACVSGTRLSSASAGDVPLVVLARAGAAIERAAIEGPGRIAVGVAADDTRVTDVVVEGASGSAIYAIAGSVTVTRVVVRDTRPERPGGEFGRGLEVSGGASMLVERAVVERSTELGLWASEASTLDARDVAILDTRPRESDGAFGRGVQAQEGAIVRLTRAVIARSRDDGLFATTGATIEATDALVHDTLPQESDDLYGRAAAALQGGHLRLERVALLDNHELGVSLSGADVTGELRDVIIARTRPELATGRFGRAVSVITGASLTVERVLLASNRDAGLFVDGATVDLRDLDIDEVLPRASTGAWGVGLWAQNDARVVASRVRVTRTRLVGVAAVVGVDVTIDDLEVRGVAGTDCAETTCPELAGGFGVAAHFGGAIRADRFVVRELATCGVVVGADSVRPTALDLAIGRVETAPVGACVQVDGYDTARLRTQVQYRDVGVPLQATSYALPDGLAD